MNRIVAYLKHKKPEYQYETVGFVFNTDNAAFAETFMVSLHYSENEYVLCFEDQKPKNGIYTEVEVIPKFYEKIRGLIEYTEYKIRY